MESKVFKIRLSGNDLLFVENTKVQMNLSSYSEAIKVLLRVNMLQTPGQPTGRSLEKNKSEATPSKDGDKSVDKGVEKPKVERVNGVIITQEMKDRVNSMPTVAEKKRLAFDLLNNPPMFDFPPGELSTWDMLILNYFK